jgi:hypothetical protein
MEINQIADGNIDLLINFTLFKDETVFVLFEVKNFSQI